MRPVSWKEPFSLANRLISTRFSLSALITNYSRTVRMPFVAAERGAVFLGIGTHMSTSVRQNRRQKTSLLSKARWAGYAAAGAATALGTYEAADAEVWRSGILNNGNGVLVDAFTNGQNPDAFPIDLPGNVATDDLVMHHLKVDVVGGEAYGLAIANSWTNTAGNVPFAKIAGVWTAGMFGSDIYFADNFGPGAKINDPTRQFNNWGTLAAGASSRCNFQGGTGNIGFSFAGTGGGTRYGWVRVEMNGPPQKSCS